MYTSDSTRQIAAWLRLKRKSMRTAQSFVADCAGVSQPTIAKIELGLQPPSLMILAGYVEAIGEPDFEEEVVKIAESAIRRKREGSRLQTAAR